ncbi:hydroxyacid dehydrogenase [Sporanaerobium hydrogeniformans]|uniref:Hydroxyacid dehydrogenase n=1 Tax=Sporanaerobium hydrogeniformans TaxID=3072179 RepID=A0AC61DHF5_9FIRM|nr:D-2-hydroxyacid dehydrogenase [Sporanaerobium hydrogeniformans]PHV72260.1 hydroxyacid dehydrogenase [Sporanaerobium hydrogeniformans]
MKLCILDAATLGKDIDITPLRKYGELVSYDLTTPEEIAERIKDVEIIITNKVILNESNLKEASKLSLIALTATGYNNIDIAYAKKRGIGVVNVAGYSTQSVAQHTFAMLFYLMEHLRAYDEYVKSKRYADNSSFTYIAWPFAELSGKTWGIIGLGAIGKEVAKIATSFGAEVIYYSSSGKHQDTTYKRVELDTLLETSDILSIHAPLNEKTKGLITYKEISKMKAEAFLLNLGRGGIINEVDLAKALNEGRLAAAGLDVLEEEPIDKQNPLLTVKDSQKLLITPHIAWASVEARRRLITEIAWNIEAYFKGEQRNRIV